MCFQHHFPRRQSGYILQLSGPTRSKLKYDILKSKSIKQNCYQTQEPESYNISVTSWKASSRSRLKPSSNKTQMHRSKRPFHGEWSSGVFWGNKGLWAGAEQAVPCPSDAVPPTPRLLPRVLQHQTRTTTSCTPLPAEHTVLLMQHTRPLDILS